MPLRQLKSDVIFPLARCEDVLNVKAHKRTDVSRGAAQEPGVRRNHIEMSIGAVSSIDDDRVCRYTASGDSYTGSRDAPQRKRAVSRAATTVRP